MVYEVIDIMHIHDYREVSITFKKLQVNNREFEFEAQRLNGLSQICIHHKYISQ